MFKKATKKFARIRMGIAGIPGSGKTYSSLKMACGIGKRVVVIDTERGSASKYSDIFDFDVHELDNYDPENYITAIKEAEKAGYDFLVIDSLSHAWVGEGGALDQVDKEAKKSKSGNTFYAWKSITPLQNKLIGAILGSNMHIIATMRQKKEYVVQGDGQGKSAPKCVGMAPIQRDDVEYEFDIFCEMDSENNLIIRKTRVPLLSGKVFPEPGENVIGIIKQWLSSDNEAASSDVIIDLEKAKELGALLKNKGVTPEEARAICKEQFGKSSSKELTLSEFEKLKTMLQEDHGKSE